MARSAIMSVRITGNSDDAVKAFSKVTGKAAAFGSFMGGMAVKGRDRPVGQAQGLQRRRRGHERQHRQVQADHGLRRTGHHRHKPGHQGHTGIRGPHGLRPRDRAEHHRPARRQRSQGLRGPDRGGRQSERRGRRQRRHVQKRGHGHDPDRRSRQAHDGELEPADRRHPRCGRPAPGIHAQGPARTPAISGTPWRRARSRRTSSPPRSWTSA